MSESAQSSQDGETSHTKDNTKVIRGERVLGTVSKKFQSTRRSKYPDNILAVSVLSADFSRLGEELEMIAAAGADYAHLDIMDGVFVPSISFGVPVMESLRPYSELIFDAHLMLTHPGRYVETFAASGADLITFHVESSDYPTGVLGQIRRVGKRASMAVKPDTPIESVYPFLEMLDMVLIMSVEPGFGRQALMERCLDKAKRLREFAIAQGMALDIEMDGGIDEDNISEVLKSGVNVAVVGSAIMDAQDPVGVIKSLLKKMGR